MVSQLVAPSFSLANSLILAEVLSAVCKCYKNTFLAKSVLIFFKKNRLEIENIFQREESIIVKNQKPK